MRSYGRFGPMFGKLTIHGNASRTSQPIVCIELDDPHHHGVVEIEMQRDIFAQALFAMSSVPCVFAVNEGSYGSQLQIERVMVPCATRFDTSDEEVIGILEQHAPEGEGWVGSVYDYNNVHNRFGSGDNRKAKVVYKRQVSPVDGRPLLPLKDVLAMVLADDPKAKHHVDAWQAFLTFQVKGNDEVVEAPGWDQSI